MTFKEYLALDAVNWSTLKELRRSALHYRHRLETPREDTVRFARGRGAHTAVLEMHRFMREYALFEGERRAGKKWEAFAEMHAGKTILKGPEYDACIAIAEAVRRHPVAAEYMAKGAAESVIRWTDPVTGIACKARPDWVSTSKPAIVDIKTTGDVGANRFSTLAARMAYHCQLAFYQGGYATAHGKVLPAVIIAVEAEAPHDVAVYRLDDDAMYAGEQEVIRLMGMVQDCRRVDVWPGRYMEEQTLRLPPWAVGEDEEDVGGLDLVVNGHSTANEEAGR